jgi:hypothetical protein
MSKEIEMLGWRRAGGSTTASRMSVINRGGYIKWFTTQEQENKMKAEQWVTVNPKLRLDDDGKPIGIKVTNGNGTGSKIRYHGQVGNDRTHIPISTKKFGGAIVAEGYPSHGEVRVEVEDDGFFVHLLPGIKFVNGGDRQ